MGSETSRGPSHGYGKPIKDYTLVAGDYDVVVGKEGKLGGSDWNPSKGNKRTFIYNNTIILSAAGAKGREGDWKTRNTTKYRAYDEVGGQYCKTNMTDTEYTTYCGVDSSKSTVAAQGETLIIRNQRF